ncbi:TPA: hypothetical protein ACH3X2_007979 [Trebouxia sp. C0005]
MRTGFGVETVLADLNGDEGPLLSSAAAAACESDQAASKAGAAQLINADVGTTFVSLTTPDKVAINRHPVPVGTILADFLRAYSEFARQPFDALRIAHKSRVVERSQWGLSFRQLAWDTDVVLEVEFGDAPAAFSATPAAAATSVSPTAAVTSACPAVKTSVPEPGSTASAVPADSTSNGSPSVHLTVTRAGAEPVSGLVPTANKLGELLAMWAQGQGLALEVIQVFHQGTAVDRACWGSSFAELGCGSSLVLDVQVQTHQQPDAASPGHANQLGHCVQLKHGETTWQVRKPDTIRLDEAIQEFMLHQVKALPYGTQYQALLADGSLVDTTLTIAGLALTPEDIVEVRWSAEAEGVHMSVRPEGSRGSGAGQHTESGNSKAQGSTRSSAVGTSAVPHTASAPPFTSASAPSVAAAVSNAASAPLMAAAVPTAAA